ncbi:unnamed protein product [Trichogramma brassicae]|uniref:Uncharacterized protein n=1 Tax=Trichogramma brassicae TaxID=86971 RepID=A0A6H5IAK8_9HYME|nr:unnamed protein product [Trichogramma brassicae]
MSPSVHIVLIHGYQIIENLPVPIGILSEEAQEANHKNVKRFRDKYSRKDSRKSSRTEKIMETIDIILDFIREAKREGPVMSLTIWALDHCYGNIVRFVALNWINFKMVKNRGMDELIDSNMQFIQKKSIYTRRRLYSSSFDKILDVK